MLDQAVDQSAKCWNGGGNVPFGGKDNFFNCHCQQQVEEFTYCWQSGAATVVLSSIGLLVGGIGS